MLHTGRAALLAGSILGMMGSLSLGSLAFHAAAAARRLPASHEPAFRIVAYLPDYRISTITPAAVHTATDLIYFSIAPTPSGGLDLTHWQPATRKRLHDLVADSSTRLLIALGGWERSAGFGPMATHPEARRHFVQALTQLCLQDKLDGVDFDWEGPANPAEEAGYSALLVETKRSFAPHNLRVTVALAAWQQLDPAGLDAADELHVMAYDHDGKHSTFQQARDDMNAFLKRKVAKQKLTLGLPFYGRNVQNRNQETTYADIVARYHPERSVDEVAGVYFNNINTIEQKTRYALDSGFGGVMVWEIGQDTDDNTSLMRAIHRSLDPTGHSINQSFNPSFNHSVSHSITTRHGHSP